MSLERVEEMPEYQSTSVKFFLVGFLVVLGGAAIFIFVPGTMTHRGALLLAGAGVAFMLIALIAWPAGLRLARGPEPKVRRTA